MAYSVNLMKGRSEEVFVKPLTKGTQMIKAGTSFMLYIRDVAELIGSVRPSDDIQQRTRLRLERGSGICRALLTPLSSHRHCHNVFTSYRTPSGHAVTHLQNVISATVTYSTELSGHFHHASTLNKRDPNLYSLHHGNLVYV